ncbi:MAG: insulinase family protein [Pirellulales bacterium]|nr:insulinase family protein [Pirellulales bacterium]
MVLVAEPMNWLESAAFALMVPAGCVHDAPGHAGLATLTSEMLTRGAGPRDSRQMIEALDNLGVERSEGVSDVHISFGGATLASSLPETLSIYADIVRRPHLAADQFEAARQVVLQELDAIEDEPQQKVMLELRRRRYPHPWGKPSLGDRAGLEVSTIADVQRHFSQLLRPNGAILGVAGRFDWDALRRDVERLFGDWKRQETPIITTAEESRVIEHLPHEANQTQIGVAYPSVPYRDADYFRAWAAVGALSGGMSSRLFTEVREKRGLCYSIYASYHTLRDWGSVLSYAGTSAERAQETLDVLLGELVRLSQGILPSELMRLKARIKSSLIMQQESSSARAASLARDWYHLERARSIEEVGKLVDGLTCETINAYLAEHPPGNFTVVTLGPQPLEVNVGVS